MSVAEIPSSNVKPLLKKKPKTSSPGVRLEPHKPLEPPVAAVKTLYHSKKLVSGKENPQDYFKMLNENKKRYTIKFNHLYHK